LALVDPLVTLSEVSVEFRHYDALSRSFKGRVGLFERESAGAGQGLRNSDPAGVTVALRDIDLSVAPQARIAVIGGNASGKTTLLRVVGGLLGVTAGKVDIRTTAGIAMEVGVGFDLDLTVGDTVRLHAILLGIEGEAAAAFKEKVIAYGDLETFEDFAVRILPPGRRGRLAISLAVNSDAELLLFDEVFESVDPEFAAKASSTIAKGRDGGYALMVVGRQRSVLDSLCDTAIVMERGRIVDQGDCAAMTKKYQDVYVY
jgi:ABC-type polysaccharide/polyol phosphate transport system ATPase subunit